jgi:hypothetical protein
VTTSDGEDARPTGGDDHGDVYPWLALIGAAVVVAILFTAIEGGLL